MRSLGKAAQSPTTFWQQCFWVGSSCEGFHATGRWSQEEWQQRCCVQQETRKIKTLAAGQVEKERASRTEWETVAQIMQSCSAKQEKARGTLLWLEHVIIYKKASCLSLWINNNICFQVTPKPYILGVFPSIKTPGYFWTGTEENILYILHLCRNAIRWRVSVLVSYIFIPCAWTAMSEYKTARWGRYLENSLAILQTETPSHHMT